MARQNIHKGTVANDGTGDTLRSAAGKINDNFVELYTLLGGDSAQVTQNVSLRDSGVAYFGDTNNTILGFVEGNSRTVILLPDSDGIIVTTIGNQTLTNKILTSAVLTTPQINDTSATHQYIFAPNELVADRTITLPLLTTNDTFVFQAHTQTLTNKRLDSAELNTPIIVGHILDENEAQIIEIDPSANAVNHIKISNSATAGIPQIASHSDVDSDVGLGLSAKNGGLIHFQTGLRYTTTNIVSDAQNVRLDRPMTIFNAGGNITAVLANGLYPGHAIIMVNQGVADVTITPVSLAPATSFTLRQEGITQVIWSGNDWHILTAKLFDSSDLDALVYVTI
jgi:hypothetical protein